MTIPQLISTYGSFAVALFVCLENIGLPLPGEAILIFAAVYAANTYKISIWAVIGAAILGSIVGSVLGYWIGRQFGYPLLLRYGRYARLTESRIKIGQYLFLRHGGKVVLVARFIAVLRSVAGILAGANCMPFRPFVIANAAGAAAWALLVGLGAYYLEEGISTAASSVLIPAGIVLTVVVIAAAVILLRQERRLAADAERALPGPLRPTGWSLDR